MRTKPILPGTNERIHLHILICNAQQMKKNEPAKNEKQPESCSNGFGADTQPHSHSHPAIDWTADSYIFGCVVEMYTILAKRLHVERTEHTT